MGECLSLKHGVPSWTWTSLERGSTLLYLAVSPVPPPFPYLPRGPYLFIYIYLFLRARILLGACYTLLDVGCPYCVDSNVLPSERH